MVSGTHFGHPLRSPLKTANKVLIFSFFLIQCKTNAIIIVNKAAKRKFPGENFKKRATKIITLAANPLSYAFKPFSNCFS